MMRQLEWLITSDLEAIEPIVVSVTNACEASGYPQRACRLNIPVALTEALSNAILRGNAGEASKTVRVRACIGEHEVHLEVTDEGSGFDPDRVRSLCGDPDWVNGEGGRGVFLMYALMDEVASEASEGHTLRLTLRRT
jgi:serine/threonine-protein kinase RsbW